MYPPMDGTQIAAARTLPRIWAGFSLLAVGLTAALGLAGFVPHLVRQMGQGCGGCALVAFEPPLKPYGGRPAPLPPPAAAPAAHLGAPVATPWFAPGLVAALGPFAPRGTPSFGDAEPRAVSEPMLEADITTAWNADTATPGLAETASPWAIAPEATSGFLRSAASGDAPRLDLQGAGEPPAARWLTIPGVGRNPAGAAPIQPTASAWSEALPAYRRVALGRELERHFAQVAVGVAPAGTAAPAVWAGLLSAGRTSPLAGPATDMRYRFELDSGNADAALIAQYAMPGHAMPRHAMPGPGAPAGALGGIVSPSMDTFRAGLAYDFGALVTPSIQYFRTETPANAPRFSWSSGRPGGAGFIAGVNVAPRSAPDSPIALLNLRFAARYVAYTESPGPARGTPANGGLSLSLWGALRF